MLNTEAKKEKVNKNKGYIAKKKRFFLGSFNKNTYLCGYNNNVCDPKMSLNDKNCKFVNVFFDL